MLKLELLVSSGDTADVTEIIPIGLPGAMVPLLVNVPAKFRVLLPLMMPVFVDGMLMVAEVPAVLLNVPVFENAFVPEVLIIVPSKL